MESDLTPVLHLSTVTDAQAENRSRATEQTRFASTIFTEWQGFKKWLHFRPSRNNTQPDNGPVYLKPSFPRPWFFLTWTHLPGVDFLCTQGTPECVQAGADYGLPGPRPSQGQDEGLSEAPASQQLNTPGQLFGGRQKSIPYTVPKPAPCLWGPIRSDKI